MTLLRLYPFLIPLAVLVLCEGTKIVLEGIETGNWKGGLFRPGGMPSSHSAFVTSLCIIVAKMTGVHSAEFAIAFTFAGITWYDAMSSRRAVGDQGKVLNLLQKKVRFSERTGHSLVEVLGGIAFGVVVTFAGIVLAA